MNAAGIDVSSSKSTVAVLRPFGEVVKLPFDVRHSVEELASLAKQLKSIEGETRVVMEHTGRYYESIAKVLHEAGLYVSAVNPLLIKEYGNNSLRKVKTDKADAMKIAKYALDNWSELRDYTPMDTIRYDLKTMNRQFQLAIKQKTATANSLIALQEQSFPGIRKLFDSPVRSDGTQKWVDFTHDFWHTDYVRSGSLNTLLSVTASGASATVTSSARRKLPRYTLWQSPPLYWCRKHLSRKRSFKKLQTSSQQSLAVLKRIAAR